MDAPAQASTPAEAPHLVLAGAEQASGNADGQAAPPKAISSQPTPPPQYLPAPAGKGRPVLWILAGFAACLLLVIMVALGARLNQPSGAPEPARDNVASNPSPSAAPVTDTSSAPTPAVDDTPPPASAPAQVPQAPPAAPQSPIVGEWKATTMVGSSIVLQFGADGKYTLKDVLDSEEGVYVFSSGDGTLRLQPNAVFSHDIVIWNCQLSGDSLSCVDPQGAGHVYARQ